MDSSNTSGQGPSSAVPPEIDRWNWGAFLLNWIWGIGNNTWIALLCFLPFIGFVMPFVLGAKGSSWAWRNKRWDSVEEFRRVQRKWALWGAVAWVGFIALFVAIFAVAMLSMKGSEIYRLGVIRLEANSEAMAALGPPISTGFPSGSFQTSGPSGTANFSFNAEGSKGKGTVYVDAQKKAGKWGFNQLELEVDGKKERIDLDE